MPTSHHSSAHPNPSDSLIELDMTGVHCFEQPFFCRPPAPDELLVVFNRFLKFQFPVHRNSQIIERFLNRQVHQPKLSKKALESLPVPVLEAMASRIWQEVLPIRFEAENTILSCLILAEEFMQYRLENWVAQDIAFLGIRHSGELHSYYFEGQLDPETLLAILEHQGYSSRFLTAAMKTKAPTSRALWMAYLADRFLSHPIPWVELLEAVGPEIPDSLPCMVRLSFIHGYLKSQGLYHRLNVTPENFLQRIAQLNTLLDRDLPEFSAIAKVVRPVRELVIVEGATEELLLPVFSKIMGLDFFQLGILVHPAGGKNQVLSLYEKFSEILDLPIFVVLDRDARDKMDTLTHRLRPGDRVRLLEEGEFEDMYDMDLILRTINEHYHPHPRVTRASFRQIQEEAKETLGRVQTLKLIWKHFHLGDFDKTHFAARLAASMESSMTATEPTYQLPKELKSLIEEILQIRNATLAPSNKP